MSTLRNVYYKLLQHKRPLSFQTKIPEHPVVTTEYGKIRGKTGIDWKKNKYYSFQGIPYAEPPLGKLRFKAPLPCKPWSGIKDGLKEGNACYAQHAISPDMIGSEDCLYLNVYTPELKASSKPVMVWIHGGKFTKGSSNTDLYGPEFLMSEDVVLVTINYRLGLLGFASFEDESIGVPGNAGMKDQILALRWVKNNISRFGGDPSNVTVFGQSAGGSSAHYLMLSPLAKGLFHRVIAQSGTALSQFAEGQRTVGLVGKALQLGNVSEKTVFNIIQNMSTNQLHSLQKQIPDRFFPCEINPLGPVVEPSFIPDKPVAVIKSGEFTQVPLMIGYTSEEGMFLALIAKSQFGKVKLPKTFKSSIPYLLNIPRDDNKLLEIVSSEIKEFYYGKEEPALDNMMPFYAMYTDNSFLREINTTVELHTNSSPSPVYYYRTSLESKLNIMKKVGNLTDPGTCHGDDLGYLFKNVLTPDINPNSIEGTAVRRHLRLWTNFARYGNPNFHDGRDTLISAEWKPTEIGKLNFMDIGDNLTVGVNPEHERLQFWKNLFIKYSK